MMLSNPENPVILSIYRQGVRSFFAQRRGGTFFHVSGFHPNRDRYRDRRNGTLKRMTFACPCHEPITSFRVDPPQMRTNRGRRGLPVCPMGWYDNGKFYSDLQ